MNDAPARPDSATPKEWRHATLLIAGHGSSFDGGRNQALHAHAEAISERSLFQEVRTVALNGAPSIDEALADMDTGIVYIAPLFMSAGQLVRAFAADIEKHLSRGRRSPPHLHTCPALGTWSEVTDLIELRGSRLAAISGTMPRETTLVLIGHGSTRSSAANETAEWHAERLRRRGVFRDVLTGYLEGEPKAADTLAKLQGPGAAVGFFAGGGSHAELDLPNVIEKYAPQTPFLKAIGEDELISDILISQVAGAPNQFEGELG